jgi:hypothetical protein
MAKRKKPAKARGPRRTARGHADPSERKRQRFNDLCQRLVSAMDGANPHELAILTSAAIDLGKAEDRYGRLGNKLADHLWDRLVAAIDRAKSRALCQLLMTAVELYAWEHDPLR